MIRFVDMTAALHGMRDADTASAAALVGEEGRADFTCAFFDTCTDRFLETAVGCHDFTAEDVRDHPEAERLIRLVPKFWEWRV